MASALSVFITPIHPLIVTKNKIIYSYYSDTVAVQSRRSCHITARPTSALGVTSMRYK